MDKTTPKISFIPKGSLVHEESFLEHPRSRNALTIFAVFVFAASVIGFGGLFFYNNSLNGQIVTRLGEIQKVQAAFNRSTQVEKAKSFRSRVSIVQGLLAAHIAVSPVLKFISDNTLSDIMYTKFSLTSQGSGALAKLEGEAPTYAALAYQREVLSKKTNELSSFTVSEVSLTSFGTVTFTLVLEFTPGYLSYVNNNGTNISSSTSAVVPSTSSSLVVPNFIPAAPAPAPSGTTTEVEASPSVLTNVLGSSTTPSEGGSGAPQINTTASAPDVGSAPEKKQSIWSTFWSWFKFW